MKLLSKQSIFVTMALMMSVFGMAFAPLASHVGAAPSNSVQEGVDATGDTDGQTNLKAAIKTAVNVLLFVLGAIAVVMIILGGIRYTLSNGDQTQVTAGKNTVLYAVIGLIVALLAYAIVGFVIDAFVPGGGGGGS